jgi:calcium-dependent protein kinase
VLRYEALYVDLKKHAGWLVMEYLPLASLARSGLRNEEDFRKVVHQLLETLQYLHRRAITHRDVKMENVLYDSHERKVKLIDFGICRKHRRRAANFEMLTITGTLYYRAPEMFEGGGYGDPVDIWAVGILLFKLVTGHTPF